MTARGSRAGGAEPASAGGEPRAPSPALEGIRVIDMGQVLAGPFCGMLLADLGAEVIKLEPPGGDVARRFSPFADGTSAYFRWVNKGKLGISLDLKTTAGIETLRGLVERSDVVVENFRPGVLGRLGLSPTAMLAVNPRIVVVSISGFGQHGPLASLPAYDLIAQAMSGLMTVTGKPGGEPTRSGVSLGDMVPGLYGALAAVAALRGLTALGGGQHIDVSMCDALLSLLESVGMRALHTDEPIVTFGNDHMGTTPFSTYEARDGPVALVVAGDEKFRAFARALGRPEWSDDPRFECNEARGRNREALRNAIERELARFTVDEAVELLTRADLPASPVLGVREALSRARQRDSGVLVEEQDGFLSLGSAARLGGWRAPRPAPRLGEHNSRVPEWLNERPRIVARRGGRGQGDE